VATLLGGLIESNLSARPELRPLLHPRRPATFVIEATDAGAAASLRVGEGRVLVRSGAVGRAEVVVRAPSGTLVGLSSVPLRWGLPDPATGEGRQVIGALLRRDLRVRGLVRHPALLARLNRLLSVR
jgi:hypothetical protein